MKQYVSEEVQTDRGWKLVLFEQGAFDENGKAVVAATTKEWPTLGEAQSEMAELHADIKPVSPGHKRERRDEVFAKRKALKAKLEADKKTAAERLARRDNRQANAQVKPEVKPEPKPAPQPDKPKE